MAPTGLLSWEAQRFATGFVNFEIYPPQLVYSVRLRGPDASKAADRQPLRPANGCREPAATCARQFRARISSPMIAICSGQVAKHSAQIPGSQASAPSRLSANTRSRRIPALA